MNLPSSYPCRFLLMATPAVKLKSRRGVAPIIVTGSRSLTHHLRRRRRGGFPLRARPPPPSDGAEGVYVLAVPDPLVPGGELRAHPHARRGLAGPRRRQHVEERSV